MRIKGITDECFTDYKLPVMYIAFPKCSFKCDIENECQLCQNSSLVHEPDIELSKEYIIERYLKNPISQGIVLAGLEPFDTPLELVPFVDCLRRQYKCFDPVIIYTGYTEEELENGQYASNCYKQPDPMLASEWECLKKYGIIVKFGRFIPNEEPHYDEVLGIKLMSSNQYAKEFPYEYSY